MMLKALGSLVKILLGVSVITGLVLIVFSRWEDDSKMNQWYACEVKRIEHRIASDESGFYTSYCMEAEGYYRLSRCEVFPTLSLPASCYIPRWRSHF